MSSWEVNLPRTQTDLYRAGKAALFVKHIISSALKVCLLYWGADTESHHHCNILLPHQALKVIKFQNGVKTDWMPSVWQSKLSSLKHDSKSGSFSIKVGQSFHVLVVNVCLCMWVCVFMYVCVCMCLCAACVNKCACVDVTIVLYMFHTLTQNFVPHYHLFSLVLAAYGLITVLHKKSTAQRECQCVYDERGVCACMFCMCACVFFPRFLCFG